jgi:putative transposase
MTKHPTQSTSVLWARFRFSVVGALLSAPPARGELKTSLESLAAKTWTHPVTGRKVRFAAKTLERWFYRARQERDDPVASLRRAVRKDCGKVSLKPDLLDCLANQYQDYPHWTYQLHYDNLKAQVKTDEKLGPLQSYSTVRRYMVAHGMLRKPRLKPKKYPGELRAAQRRERREIRSYEAEYVGALWLMRTPGLCKAPRGRQPQLRVGGVLRRFATN